MVLRIACIYGYEMDKKRVKELIGVVAGGVVFRTIAQVLVKLIPGVGSVIGPGIAYSGTVAIGEVAIKYFENGMKISTEEAERIYKRVKEQAQKDFRESGISTKIDKHKKEAERLRKQLEKGEISKEKFTEKMQELLQ